MLWHYTKVTANWGRGSFYQKLQIQKKAFSAFRSVSGGWFEQYVSQTKGFKLCSQNQRQKLFLDKGVLKYAANLQENLHAEVQFQWSCRTTPSSPATEQLLCNFIIEIALWHGCSPVNLLHIFRALFLKSNSAGLLLCSVSICYLHYIIVNQSVFACLFLKSSDKTYEVESVCINSAEDEAIVSNKTKPYSALCPQYDHT